MFFSFFYGCYLYFILLLAALSSSRSLVIGWLVGLLVGWLVCYSVGRPLSPLEYQIVTKTSLKPTYLVTNLCDSSDCSDSRNSSDISDGSDSSNSSDCSDSNCDKEKRIEEKEKKKF